ncbi:unnamed protein product [Rotaria sp. Silwood1]|nr:unnamed protein product [Rotaria sp. Silwood1]CAF5104864.1 unnamed protein product [Rotaria sp. Silwood1]
MAKFSSSGSTGKTACISLHGLSYEVCVAATQAEYWQQLKQNSNISISSIGNYVPVELGSLCNDEEEPKLQLIIQSQSEQDNEQFDIICDRIHYDLMLFETNDRPVYDYVQHQVIVSGSLFNSLKDIFDTERQILGQRVSEKYLYLNKHQTIILELHEKRTIMDLAVMQIQELVRQAQSSYFTMYVTKIGRTLLGPTEQMATHPSTSNPVEYPSLTLFQPSSKRKRTEDKEQKPTSGQSIIDSDQSDDDETKPKETWY